MRKALVAEPTIGGSDIAAVLGVSRWRTPLDVYCKLLGVTRATETQTEAAFWGVSLEPNIAQHYGELHPEVRLVGDVRVRHPDHPWATGTPDRIVVGVEEFGQLSPMLATKKRGPVAEEDCFRAVLASAYYGLEVKTAGARSAKFWGESGQGVPEEYYAQCQWYLFVTGLDRWDVAVLLAGQEYREYTILSDQELHGIMLEAASRFMVDCVARRVPPVPDATDRSAEALKALFPIATGDMIRALDADEVLAGELRDAETAVKEAEGVYALAENQMKARIGAASGIEGRFGRVTWRNQKDSPKVDWEEIARSLAKGPIPAKLIDSHTGMRPGPRVFLKKWSD